MATKFAPPVARHLALASGLIALCLALWAPARSEAAPQGPWVQPASDLSAPGGSTSHPRVAIGSDGTAAAVWHRSIASNRVVQVSIRPPGGVFGPPENLSPTDTDSVDPRVAVGPDGTTTVVWEQESIVAKLIQARTRPPGGVFEPAETISDPTIDPGNDSYEPAIAVGSDGTTAISWYESYGHAWARARIRPPGGSFGAPETLSEAGENAFEVTPAVMSDGGVTVVWHRSNGTNTVIQASTRPAGSGSFGPAVNLSVATSDSDQPQIAAGPDGTVTVVWRQDFGSHFVALSKTRPPGGSFQMVASILSSIVSGDADEPQISIGADGTAAAIWDWDDGSGDDKVQTKVRPPGEPFGVETATFAGTGEDINRPGIAVGPDGTVSAVFSHNVTGPGVVIDARTRPPGGSFGDGTEISPTGENSYDPDIAIGPDGRATAVWILSGDNIIQTASTQPPEYTLDVTKDGDGAGTVTSAPAGIDCGSDCTEDYPSYAKVALTATPDTGSSFSGWSGACEGEAGTTCELDMDEAKTATGSFEADQPPEVICPPKTLKPGKLKRNKEKGTAKLKVTAGGAGKVVLRGSKKVRKFARVVGANGKGTLKVRPKRKLAKKLKKKGKAKIKVKVKLIYRPGGECPQKTKTRKVKLIRK